MGNFLGLAEMSRELINVTYPGFKVSICEVNGYRPDMEDKIIYNNIYNDWYLFGVLDGHGGHICANIISVKLVQELSRFFNKHKGLPTDEKLIEFFIEFDQTIANMDAGTTAALLLLNCKEGKAVSLNVGDSSIYMYDKKSKNIIFEAVEHTPKLESERERILNVGGFVENGRVNGELAVSRAFGDIKFKSNMIIDYLKNHVIAIPDIVHHDINNGLDIFITCDGLYENNGITKKFVCEYMTKTTDHDKSMCTLLDKVVDKGSKDNCSLMHIQIDDTYKEYFKTSQIYPGVMNNYLINKYEDIRQQYMSVHTHNALVKIRMNNLCAFIEKCIQYEDDIIKNQKIIPDCIPYCGYLAPIQHHYINDRVGLIMVNIKSELETLCKLSDEKDERATHVLNALQVISDDLV